MKKLGLILLCVGCAVVLVAAVVMSLKDTQPNNTSSDITSSEVSSEASSEEVSSEAPLIPNVMADKTEIYQGDMLTLTATALKDPVIEADFEFQPKFFADGEGIHTSFVPINYKLKEGDYNLKITAEDFEKTLTITVKKFDFDIQNMYIDQEIADDTVNSANADWELYVAMKPVKELSDNEKYYSGEFILPVNGEITTEYGMIRYVNDEPTSTRHSGVDIATDAGTPIVAPNRGRVILAQYLQMTGNTIVIEHGFGLKSIYYHMSELSVEVDDMVEKGQEIGKIGSTGFSTGPHLHFSMAVNNVWVNPWLFVEDPRK